MDERLLLNDILPPGLHGEKWSGNVTRSALTQYHNDVENYIQKKLALPPHVWGSHSGADICASPTSSFTGPRTVELSSSTSTRVDGDDDDDDDDQSNQVFITRERDGNDDNDDDGSSSASASPRDGEERQKAPESEAMGEHTAPGGDAFEQHRGGDVRAHSPIEILPQSYPVSQCAGNLSPHQGGDLSIQSRPVEISLTRLQQWIRKHSLTPACGSQLENSPGHPRATV